MYYLRRALEALSLVPGHGDGGRQRRGPVGHDLQLPGAVVTPFERCNTLQFLIQRILVMILFTLHSFCLLLIY